MRLATLIATLFFASTLWAGPVKSSIKSLEVVEMKDGTLHEATGAEVKGDKLYIKLHVPNGRHRIEFAVPLAKVVPEFVYYVWANQIAPGDTPAMVKLADWARKNGLHRLALKSYTEAAEFDAKLKEELVDLTAALHEEEARWLVDRAEHDMREEDVKTSRLRLERVLKDFGDTKEKNRARELLKILAERERFLTEQRRQEAIGRRARKQKREIDRYVKAIRAEDRSVLRARMRNTFDAQRRLNRAAYTYRRAMIRFAELTLIAEVENLRHLLNGLREQLRERMASTFLKLADLRFIMGDRAGALDAVHEVLAVAPAHTAAGGLREKILDAPVAPRPTVTYANPYPLGIRHRLPTRQPFRRRIGFYGSSRTGYLRIGLARGIYSCGG